MLKLYRTGEAVWLESDGQFRRVESAWDELINRDDLAGFLQGEIGRLPVVDAPPSDWVAPVGSQEVWAAGVTYHRSLDARMEEAKGAGGSDFYDRVYNAVRPELFFKATASAVVGPGGTVRIRRDSHWSVPEPELTLVVNARQEIVGYTIGNDMSSRDIEGDNPLYLPQAKVYDGSCAIGPCVLVAEEPLASTTEIRLEISRGGNQMFEGGTTLESLKRTPQELVEYLYMEHSHPAGCLLMTGTGVVPPDAFTLKSGDEVRITIKPIGALVNFVQ